MKQRSSVCLMKWLALMLVSLLPLSGIAAEPVKGVQISSAIDLTLPIHQKPKLHPELSDPLLGDQAQIVEWAWSPQYAKRFGLPVQPDGLKDNALWLVGIKVMRIQDGGYQRYACRIIGLIDNKTSILTPPGDRFMRHPAESWIGGLPKKIPYNSATGEQNEYVAAQAAWYKQPKNKLEKERPETGLGTPYILFHRFYSNDLAYFELDGSCGAFRDPAGSRNELRFPTRIDGKNDEDKQQSAVYEPSAVHFDIPDGLMQKMYPNIREAEDWTSCFMTRIYGKKAGLTTRALKSKRFGNACNPPVETQAH